MSDSQVQCFFPQFCAPLISDSNHLSTEGSTYFLPYFPGLHLFFCSLPPAAHPSFFILPELGVIEQKWGGERKVLFNRYNHYQAFMFFGLRERLKLTPSLLRLVLMRSPSGNIWLQLPQDGSSFPLGGHLKTHIKDYKSKQSLQLLYLWVQVLHLCAEVGTLHSKKQSSLRFPVNDQAGSCSPRKETPLQQVLAFSRLGQALVHMYPGTKVKFLIQIQPHGGLK